MKLAVGALLIIWPAVMVRVGGTYYYHPSRRGAVFCEYSDRVKTASGDVWPCLDVHDEYQDHYDCHFYAYLSCDDNTNGSACENFSHEFADFDFVDTYLIQCSYAGDEWAGLCEQDAHGVWRYTDAYCHRGREAIISLVEDSKYHRHHRALRTESGRGGPLPSPTMKVPNATETEINGKKVLILNGRN